MVTMATSRRFTIGEFAARSGLTPKALRLYDDLGLLRPAEVDAWTGYRRYDADQLDRARLVATLRLIGMPLARIRTVLDADGTAEAGDVVAAYWRQVESDTAARRDVVTTLLRRLDEENTMDAASTDTAPLSVEIGVRCEQGARERQQDAVSAAPDLVAVADGFGERDDLAAAALAAFARGGFDDALAATEPGGQDTGTTLTAVVVDGTRAHITHVGDGRVVVVRDGEVQRLTHDHTLVASLLESGQLSAEEARSHPHRSLLARALNGRPVVADRTSTSLRPGDRLVVTTDGVHGVLDDLAALLTAPRRAQQVADAVAAAVEAAGAPDNHSVVVLDVAGSSGAES